MQLRAFIVCILKAGREAVCVVYERAWFGCVCALSLVCVEAPPPADFVVLWRFVVLLLAAGSLLEFFAGSNASSFYGVHMLGGNPSGSRVWIRAGGKHALPLSVRRVLSCLQAFTHYF